nr:hypothetical protein [uncultured Mediterranean phage uvMED]
MNTINRFVIHATSEGKPHSATIDHYSRFAAVQMFTAQSVFSDTVINSIDELGPIDKDGNVIGDPVAPLWID